MKHGSLFSGIGGFDLAAHWAGWENVFQVEWNKYCQKVLKKNFPDANIFGDIRKFDGRPWRGTVDVVSGGFPCQPYSSAGKRLGKEDERHMWPEMLRIIREIQPRWVVGENVFGLVNWSGGLVFDEVQVDLEAAGYEVQPFVLPAASVNAPHQRQRVWFVAYRSGEQMGAAGQPREHGGLECVAADSKSGHEGRNFRGPVIGQAQQSGNGVEPGAFADASGIGQKKWAPKTNGKDKKEGGAGVDGSTKRHGHNGTHSHPNGKRRKKQHTAGISSPTVGLAGRNPEQWYNWPTQPPVCGRNDGIPHRMDRIAALGNAVVPQLVWRIFDAINQYENLNPCQPNPS